MRDITIRVHYKPIKHFRFHKKRFPSNWSIFNTIQFQYVVFVGIAKSSVQIKRLINKYFTELQDKGKIKTYKIVRYTYMSLYFYPTQKVDDAWPPSLSKYVANWRYINSHYDYDERELVFEGPYHARSKMRKFLHTRFTRFKKQGKIKKFRITHM